ncbi:MFS transporter [Peribacillus asahii]|uniref:MFS transporter n=1 Tax=Peribacillus asahii TaxID=228899 RepID=UPI00207A8F7F|nr:MFS transporter [Peribacillus asahii]USK58436.1 MFS transporter [Peribacillus asahii]
MQYIEFGTPAYRRIFLSMLLGSTVTFAILYSPQPLIHTFSKQFNISPSTSSLTISFATVALAVSMLFITVFSNAWGRKKIMGISLLLTSLVGILASFSPNFETLIFLRIVQGIAMGGFPAIAMTYLSEEVSPRHIGRIMGIYIGGSAFGGFLGRVIVSTLTDFFSWHIALLVLGLFSLIGSLLFWMYLPESQNFKKAKLSFGNWATGISGGLKNKSLFCIYGIGFLLMGVYVSLFNYIGFPLSKSPYHLSQTAIGFLFIFQLTGSWSSYLFGNLTERYSRSRLVSVAIVMALIGSLMTLSSNIFLLIIGLVLFASGFFAAHSIASGWIGIISPPRSKAYASSLYLLFYYIGSSLIGWFGGVFLSHFGWGGVIFMICGLLIFTSSLVIVISQSLRLSRMEAVQTS